LSSNILSLYCVFDVRNLVLWLTRELIKFIDYTIMLKLQCKTTFNSTFVDFVIMFFKNVVLYEIYSKILHWSNTSCTSLYIITNIIYLVHFKSYDVAMANLLYDFRFTCSSRLLQSILSFKSFDFERTYLMTVFSEYFKTQVINK
jgi:hypothetical protein